MRTLQRVWFPLRSNVAYFETSSKRLDLEGRIKEMALLSEELLFEPGLLDVAVTDHGVTSFWLPPGTLDDESIRRRRDAARLGQPVYLGVAKQSQPGQPAEGPSHTLITGPLQQAFVAEYELSLREWGLDEAPWVRTVWLKDEFQSAADALAKEERRGGLAARDAPKLSDNGLLDSRLKDDLTRDLSWSAVMGTPVAIDELHRPMLEYKLGLKESRFESQDAPGASALEVWVPDFSGIPWSDIIALHDHDAIGAFRHKLNEA
jgi:hypothetical protein